MFWLWFRLTPRFRARPQLEAAADGLVVVVAQAATAQRGTESEAATHGLVMLEIEPAGFHRRSELEPAADGLVVVPGSAAGLNVRADVHARLIVLRRASAGLDAGEQHHAAPVVVAHAPAGHLHIGFGLHRLISSECSQLSADIQRGAGPARKCSRRRK
jgi:hypothetical protein